MGSPLRATVVGATDDGAPATWRAIAADVDETERALSRFLPGSDLTRLNLRAGDGGWAPAPPRLLAMLAAARRAWRLTDGRFDPRVLAKLEELGEIAGISLPTGAAPSATDPWCEAKPRQGVARVVQPVDSGGIGKGLALRWASRAGWQRLTAARARGASEPGLLIEAGGDLVARGAPPDGNLWRVAIEDPRGGEALAVVTLADGALATSSVGVRRWQSPTGDPVHHLIDPATGAPGGGGLEAVTVGFADPAWAEVWSKALFLAGPARIGPTARRRGLAAWWVAADGTLEMTPAARERTIWERPRPVAARRSIA